MDSILPAILAVGIILLASLTIGRSSFTSFQTMGAAWQEAEERSIERVRSDISITSAVPSHSFAGTTDDTAVISVTENPGNYVQASDGQLTVFVVNQDESNWIRVDDISVTVTTALGSSVYDFTGITSPSASDTAEDGEIDVSDTVIEEGTFGARRNTIAGWADWGEATTAEYGNLVGSDDAYYQSANPGGGDNAAMIFEFTIAEAPASITGISVSLEGAQGAATDAWFVYLWDYTASSYAVCCSDVDIVVANDGATALVDFSRMDVVAQYQSPSALVIKYIDFSATISPQPSDTWTVLSVNDDVIDPRVVNTNESMTARLRLFPALGVGTSNWLQVTTELGISASTFYTN